MRGRSVDAIKTLWAAAHRAGAANSPSVSCSGPNRPLTNCNNFRWRPIRWTGKTKTGRTCRAVETSPVRRLPCLFLVVRLDRLGLLLGRRQAFEALEQLFLGHPVGGHLGVDGIDAGAGGADQRHSLGLRLVDL